MNNRLRDAAVACLAAIQVACGGGGDDSAPAAPAPAPAPAPDRFTPAPAPTADGATLTVPAGTKLTDTLEFGESMPHTFAVTLSDPSVITGSLAVNIVGTHAVLNPGISLVPTGGNTYSVTVFNSMVLGVGDYTGSLQIRLCQDSACVTPYPIAPLSIPYDVKVTAPTATVTPGPLTASAPVGSSVPIYATVTPSNPWVMGYGLFARVVDSGGAVLQNAELAFINPMSELLTLHTSPALAAGSHAGNLEILLCRDAACASRYPFQPIQVPYNITVTP